MRPYSKPQVCFFIRISDRSDSNYRYFEHSIGGQGHPIECPFTIKGSKYVFSRTRSAKHCAEVKGGGGGTAHAASCTARTQRAHIYIAVKRGHYGKDT